MTHGRTCRWRETGVDDTHAVASDRWECVLGVDSEPLRREPRAPHGVQLRLPRRVVPQDCERGVQCGVVQSCREPHARACVRQAGDVSHAAVMRDTCEPHASTARFSDCTSKTHTVTAHAMPAA